MDRNRAKYIKASIYASKKLCYHLDERHKATEDGYAKHTAVVAWRNKIKEFAEYKLTLLTKEVGRYLRAPMYVGFSLILLFTFDRLTTPG